MNPHFRIFLLFCIISFLIIRQEELISAIKSTTGTIKFDVNNDSNEELTVVGDKIGIGLTPIGNLHVSGNSFFQNGKIGLGTSSPLSGLEINGTWGFGFESTSSNTTLSSNTLVMVDSSSDNITISLPYAGNMNGRVYTIKKTSFKNRVIISGNIDTSASGYIMVAGSNPVEFPTLSVYSNGNQWYTTEISAGIDIIAPTSVGNLVLWLDADDTSTMLFNSGNVTDWNDKSGLGHHASQGATNDQPLLVANELNNRSVLRFDGGSDHLDVSDFSLVQPTEVFIIVKWNATNDMIMDGTAVNTGSLWTTSTAGDLRMYAGLILTRTVGTMGEWRLLTCAFNGSSSQMRSSGSMLGAVGDVGSANMGGITIGASGTGSNPLDGDIGEILIYNKALTNLERIIVVMYLNQRWGIY